MFRKRIALLACFAALLLLTLAPLGAQDDISGELKFIYWGSTVEDAARWQTFVDMFNTEYPNVKVNLIGVPGDNWSAYLNGTATLIAGGEQPDLIWVATEGVRLLVSLGLLRPFDDLIERDAAELQEFFDDVEPSLLNSFVVDGQTYMFPYSWNNMVVHINTNRLAEVGLEMPPADWTRDEFLEYAKALTVDADGDGNPERYGFALGIGGMFTMLPFVFANDTTIVSDDFCAPTVNTPEVIEALQFMHDMIYVYKVSPGPSNTMDVWEAFRNGDIGMFGAGRWPIGNMLANDFTAFDIQLWPGNPNQKTIYGVDGFGIFTTSQNPEAAWAWAKFMTGKVPQDRLVGSPESPLSNIPARRSTAEQLSQYPPANYQIFYGSLKGNVELVPSPARFNEMENIFVRYTGLIFADEMSVEDAMNAAQAELESVVTC
jgi:multiple sugar transport system substrate-binding protein